MDAVVEKTTETVEEKNIDVVKAQEVESTTVTSSYDNYCGAYRIQLKLTASNQLIIEAVQRRTHQTYKSLFENDKCAVLTEAMFRTNDELFAYLTYLMDNNCEVKDEINPKKLTAEQSNANLELKIITATILGASKTIDRGCQLELVKVEVEDVPRLENIINDLHRRVEDLESRIVPREQAVRLKELKFQKPTNTAAFTFTNDDRTCANNGSSTQQILVVDRSFSDKLDRYLKVDFVWDTAVGTSYVGVTKGLPTSETDVATNSDDRWFFNVSTGALCSKEKSEVAYLPGAIKQGQRVGVILDTENMRLAFAVDEISLTWAYELLKTVKPDELYACIIVYNPNETVSIANS